MPSTKAPPPFDPHHVRELAQILEENGLTEIEVERAGARIRIARSPAQAVAFAPAPAVPATPQAYPAAPPAAGAGGETGETVTSPMVGTVYLQAQPGAEPFCKVGDTVVEGQTLLLIEAMKTMNPIAAPRAGRIIEFLIADAQPVEYGEPLVVIG